MLPPVPRLALALLLAAAPLAAQSNVERVVNGLYTPSHDYDLLHQRIELRNFDWDSTSFDGRVTLTLASLRPGLDSVMLDMGRTLEVRSVTPACGRRGAGCGPLGFARPGDSLVVRLPRAAGFGDTVRFTVDYHGRIRQGYGLYFFKDDGRPHRPQQVYSGGGTDGNPRWLPTWAGPADKATWDLIATVPAPLTVVSNGRLVSERPAPAGLRTTALAAGEAGLHLPHLAHGRAVREDRATAGAAFRWTTTSTARTARCARPLFGVTPDMMETFSRLTGVPLSLGQVRADHRGRLRRRHGERQRHHAGGLAARCPGLPGRALVPPVADSRTSWPTSGSATWSPRRTGPTTG